MSIKVTRKELKEDYVCIGCGYCQAQDLLTYKSADFYTCGVYGWNFDGYVLYNSINGRRLLLTTGYRNMIYNENIKDDFKIIRKYNQKAKDIYKEDYRNYTREQEQNLINNLIDEIYEKLY